ncbi:MAG: HepT-like ribonuclease domain-containing protein [Gemmatimonadota bacterium]
MSDGRLHAVERLERMEQAVQRIAEYVRRGEATFLADSAVRDAIVYQLVVLGETSKSVLNADPSIAEIAPSFPWRETARMRDRLTHHYWATDDDVVWITASQDVPDLGRALRILIDDLS